MKSKVLITGAAGFIGSHLAEYLVHLGYQVIGLDNFDDFYSPAIKWNNIHALKEEKNFNLKQGDIRDESLLAHIFQMNDINVVIHMAARAGVRPSIQQPLLYQDINIGGTLKLLEVSRTHDVNKFIFMSSSSVYGLNNDLPFNEDDKVESPTSPYAASKAAAELYCHTYNVLYGLPVIVLRLFTVYGPRQRPEMAISHFVRMIDSGKTISLFGNGTSKRDYTYVDDIIDGIYKSMTYMSSGFEIFNLGDSHPIGLDYMVSLIEENLKKKAMIERLPEQPGDTPITYAKISKAEKLIGYRPKVMIENGLPLYIRWYQEQVAKK
jgi:UDP-glucuronate 4-epimerase